jgi:hypothetical protein
VYFLCFERGENMTLNTTEIQRKARLGIALTNPTKESTALYNQYRNPKPTTPKVVQPKQPSFTNKPVTTQVKQPTYQQYKPGTAVGNLNQTASQYGGSRIQTNSGNQYMFANKTLSENEMSEYAYYKNQINDLSKKMYGAMNTEVQKGYGVGVDFSKKVLSPMQRQIYEIEDLLKSKYGLKNDGESSYYGFYGLDRDSMGMNKLDANGFRMFDTAEEQEAQERLIQQGMDPQKAYEQIRKINPNVKYSPSNPFPGGGGQMSAMSMNQQFSNPKPKGTGNPSIDKEILRKASNGIALTDPKYQDIYNQWQSYLTNEIKRKAGSEQTLTDSTPWKESVYSQAQGAQKQDDYVNKIGDTYDKQQQALTERFNAQRDRAVGQINQQKSELAPQYASLRNQTDVVNSQNVARLRELMASQGLSGSGENVTSQVALGSARQGALNQLNAQEQQQRNDYDRRIADANNPSELNALMAQLEAERARAMLEGESRTDELAYQRERDSVMDERWKTQFEYGKQQDAQEKAWRQYTYNNMSAAEKSRMETAKQQFGEEMAWKLYQMQYQGEIDKSMNQSQIDFYKNAGFNPTGGGGDYYKTASQASKSETFGTYQNHLKSAIDSGAIPAGWAQALTELVGRESSWNSNAKNPNSTAHGYGQFLNSTRSNYEKKTGLDYDNPVHQLIMMAQYVKDRYGTPDKALAFWNKNKWY